jgi:hypothetical protein
MYEKDMWNLSAVVRFMGLLWSNGSSFAELPILQIVIDVLESDR